ncbi:DNA-binding transcriptional MerR regulator [Lederbergia galactosidilyticus]|uniref:MerR family DNA-binding transcriptional regulator n=1 Tax=Lederbergia galactosidilytica TaxID=217031 RepID=UPI001AEB7928|nr:MerR family DNA-binding transcriptional regulator [Lederbergia galactosidilytica]MBP1913961.1 DNA-binding transcriptional MerR regulator [Lederbergia galactosidilytica]
MKKIRPIDIAKKLNISTSSLRSYEERGIVPKPERSSTGYRIYTEEHVAYFECIVAMSPGFGMDITSAVLKNLQRKELDAALWIINNAQVANYEDKIMIKRVNKHLENLTHEHSITTGELSLQTNIPPTTLRYWEKEGFITSKRDELNNYRLFDTFQLIKVLLMKITQNAVYSYEVIQIKKEIKNLNQYDLEEVRKVIHDIQKHIGKRNQKQLKGIFYLYKLSNIKSALNI